jgi:hypothetical protein
MKKKIFILDSGFVYIGIGQKIKNELLGDSLHIYDCSNIRYWGTSKGLGQLAIEGKQQKTKLDYIGSVTVPINRVNHIVDLSKTALNTF